MTRENISRMEQGVGRIDADLLPQIARFLGVSPADFFEEQPLAPVAPGMEAVARASAEIAADIAVQKIETRLKPIADFVQRLGRVNRLPYEELRVALREELEAWDRRRREGEPEEGEGE